MNLFSVNQQSSNKNSKRQTILPLSLNEISQMVVKEIKVLF